MLKGAGDLRPRRLIFAAELGYRLPKVVLAALNRRVGRFEAVERVLVHAGEERFCDTLMKLEIE